LAGLSCAHWLGQPAEHTQLIAKQAGTSTVDDSACASCHADQADRLGKTVHRKALGCQRCHGPGGEHMADPPQHIAGATELRALPAFAQSQMCLGCHGALTLPWSHADHATAGLTCVECHTNVVHFQSTSQTRAPVAFRRQEGFCNQCHRADTLDFQQIFHHPVPEGAMDCGDCHAVHGKQERGFTLVGNSGCGRCHRRQVEPRVFEHPALREGCQTCHQAHGSPLRALLTEQGNTVCLKCHFQSGFPIIEGSDHTTYLSGGALCYDCHVEVHGSNTDPTFVGRLR
jgi:DmsE family decaheme c-type cytochrome